PNQVTVKLYSGGKAEGKPEITLVATPSSGKWKTPKLTSKLPDGKYTVQASEESTFKGNPEGHSTAITFEVITGAPSVTVNEVPERSKLTEPTFSGTVSSTGEGPVRVVVTEGATFEGRIVEEKEAELKEGRWKSPPVPLPVGSGSATFTVIARARSAI